MTSYSQNVTLLVAAAPRLRLARRESPRQYQHALTVSAVAQNAADVDPNTSGIQVYEGAVVQYSGSPSDANGNALTAVVYTVNRGR